MRWLVGVLIVAGAVVLAMCTNLLAPGRPAAWELRTHPSRSATTIAIDVLGGGCGADDEELGTVSVEETATSVVIKATLRKPRAHDLQSVCPDILRLHPTSVTLAAPLGDRVLLDAHYTQDRP